MASHSSDKADPIFFSTRKEQELLDNSATLFANLTQLEYLEKAYLKGIFPEKLYEEECQKLIAKCNTAFTLISGPNFKTIKEFCQTYQAEFQLALSRINEGKPITSVGKSGKQNKNVANVVTLFITLIDKLHLSILSVDQLYPDLRDLTAALALFPSEYTNCKSKVFEWNEKMSKMCASEELNSESARQFLFDLDNSLNTFHSNLE